MSSNKICLEICVDNLESALIAQTGGASRLELCQALDLGGLTPSVGLIAMAKQKIEIPIFMMIRPRSGNFCYTDNECLQMIKEIELGISMEVDGFVTGALKKNKDGTLSADEVVCSRLIEAAQGKPVTFHRAFDLMTCSLETALNDVIDLGFARILTSGRATIALEGMSVIKDLVCMAGSRIIIMPGSGLSGSTVRDIYRCTKANEFHSSGVHRKNEPEEPVLPIVEGAVYHKSANFFIVSTLRILLQQAKDYDGV